MLTHPTIEKLIFDREVEHLADERKGSVRHDRRTRGDLLEQLADIPPLDVADLPSAPPRDDAHVGLLASPFLVRRAVQEPNVLAPAALLAGVALDVLARQVRKGLGLACFDFSAAWSLP